ncbi:FHA domain protein [Clostridium cavendishii DSM 21758]|uniref:FHA domain protein n=1 Tax=Clostridium cavendishii DSM 21758 TaxID=1121302 RepID=A0A1M6TVJ2_9CLOT|nr:FHA domain-containing protein [Clostridium cavendishii]SHK61065.1 FHA domain protein [Clostridium cavendishii DSM 21758]
MNFTKLISGAFALVFIVILYSIIYYALKIMYRDVKGGGRKRSSAVNSKKAHGLEVMATDNSETLKIGSVIPVRGTLSIGRKGDNSICLNDQFVSSHHAKLYVRNNDFYLEDLDSTNGSYVNGGQITGRVKLKVEDEVKLGSTIFKVIG